jgi:NitT/TauT family transport system ATP-binding protein
MSARIIANDIVKIYPSARGNIPAIDHFSLTVEEGEFVCIVGPSGCGKSTFLRILAGLIPHTSGEVEIIPGDDPTRPLNSMVFQEYAIYPWKKVIDNVAFGLEMRGISKRERHKIAMEWLGKVGLHKFAQYYPKQLSGGMKQRVSIARALANDPEVLLMDEPLGALDAQTRMVLQDELMRIWESQRKTVVYITHSLDEAILLGDPGTNKATFNIDIPRPRNLQTMATPEFARMKGHIWEALQDEVMQSMRDQYE